MAYITLEELKDTLPAIMNDWIDVSDESWEWIFNAIEHNCHVGKKKKDKKPKKKDMQNAMEIAIMAHRNDINELNNKISKLNDICNAHTVRLDRISQDITAAKSMAEIAKQRTDVNYDQISKTKNDADVIQDVYNRMAGRGATREELDGFRDLIHKYDALEKKEIPISRCNPEDKDCKTCKYYCGEEAIDEPCIACDAYQCWEAKNNG